MPRGDKTPSRYDWPALYSEFHEACKNNDMLTLNAWTQVKGMNYTSTSRQFAEISRMQTGEIGAILAPRAMRKLGALLDSEDEGISHKVSTAILDRVGHSPQAQIINIQQSNQANLSTSVIIPPMIQTADTEDFNKMIAGSDE